MTATVAVVGGGYGGITVAQSLDEDVNVVLIEPKDAFVHGPTMWRHCVRSWTPHGRTGCSSLRRIAQARTSGS